VGFLDSFERSVERAVGGAFAKTFRSGVHPLEMVAAVKREMDSRAVIVSRTRILVPQHYSVSLSPEDFRRMSGLGGELISELTEDVTGHLDQQGYQAPGTITISLHEDSSLSEGMVAVAARVPQDGIVWILVLEYDGRRYPIVRRHTLIGRGSDADISIRAKGVSRRHCEIVWDGSRAEIVDLGSTNGTSLDGVEITRAALPDQCHLDIGQARIVVQVVPQTSDAYHQLLDTPQTATEDAG
jgi:hypothetical protein